MCHTLVLRSAVCNVHCFLRSEIAFCCRDHCLWPPAELSSISNKLYWYVLFYRVWCLTHFNLKTVKNLLSFWSKICIVLPSGLKLGMVFQLQVSTRVYTYSYHFWISKEKEGKNRKKDEDSLRAWFVSTLPALILIKDLG